MNHEMSHVYFAHRCADNAIKIGMTGVDPHLRISRLGGGRHELLGVAPFAGCDEEKRLQEHFDLERLRACDTEYRYMGWTEYFRPSARVLRYAAQLRDRFPEAMEVGWYASLPTPRDAYDVYRSEIERRWSREALQRIRQKLETARELVQKLEAAEARHAANSAKPLDGDERVIAYRSSLAQPHTEVAA